MRLVYVHIYVQLYFMQEELPESETVEIGNILCKSSSIQEKVTQRTQTNGVLIYEDQGILIYDPKAFWYMVPNFILYRFTSQTSDYA